MSSNEFEIRNVKPGIYDLYASYADYGSTPNRYYTYGVVARLAMLAAAEEVRQLVEADDALGVKATNA